MSRRSLVLAAVAITLVGACSAAPPGTAGATGAAASPPASTLPIDTVVDDGVSTAEIGRAARADLTDKGGTVQATGSNGVTYGLTVPEGAALTPVPVTMTPVREVRGLERGPAVLAAVRLEPAGTVFATPLDLAIPFTGSIAAGEVLYAVVSSDGGDTWDTLPVRLDAGTARVEIFHFSHIALVAGGFDDTDLSQIQLTTGATDEFRRRVARVAVARTAEEALPRVRPILREWLEHLRGRAQDRAAEGPAAIDAAALLGLVSDRVAMYTSMTESLESFLSSGELDGLLREDAMSVLLQSVDEPLGDAMDDAVTRAAEECAREQDVERRWRIAAEQFGWYRIGFAMQTRFGFAFDRLAMADYEAFSTMNCPRVELDGLELGPDGIEVGGQPRVSGQIRLQVGERSMSGTEFLAGSRFDITVSLDRGITTPAGGVQLIETEVDGGGQVDLPLPPATATDVGVTVLVCYLADAALAVFPCRDIELQIGPDDEEIDLIGSWTGDFRGGNLAAPARAAFRLQDEGEQSDGSHAFEGLGELEDVTLTGFAVRLPLPFEGRLEVRVYEGGRVRGTLAYEVVAPGLSVSCEGTIVGDGTVNEEGDRLTITFPGGSECLRGPDLVLELAKA